MLSCNGATKPVSSPNYAQPDTPTIPSATILNVDIYINPFNAYPPDIVEFFKNNNLPLISLKSLKGQALALMSQPEASGKHIGREEADKFFRNIGMKTSDAIQSFNKPMGLKRIKSRGNYCLQYPFESDTTDLDKRKGVSISGDRNSLIDTIKNWWRKNLINVPNEEWQIGHLDPTIGDASEKNLAYQPPIQGRFRDRFKFDAFFLKMWPTATELIPKIDEYYTDNEQKAIYESLKKKFEKE